MRYTSIKEYLERTKKTETQMASELGIAQSFLNEIKNCKKRPSPDLALKIEALTGIPLRCLLFPKNAA